jgi:cytochrome P450
MSTDAVTFDPVRPRTPDEVDLLHRDVLDCPHHANKVLRDQAPVWWDDKLGGFAVSRYDTIRRVITDPETFANGKSQEDLPIQQEKVRRMIRVFEEKGWVPARTLAGRDDPNHKQMRGLFEQAFRASRIKAMDPFVEETAYSLIDDFIADGRCDFVRQFAVPLPLIVIIRQMGGRLEDMWNIKRWTDAWIKRIGRMQSEEEDLACVELEIEMQHYFQPIFERLRREPDDTLLSDLVNVVIPEWGRPLTDNELHAEIMADGFGGGSETTTNALSAGVRLLIENPDVWERLKAEPDKHLRTFIEEVLRLESPAHTMIRIATRDVELEGVHVPKGSVLYVRYTSANYDERHFENPWKLDLDRANAASHLAFGGGVHHCMGAPLARRELYWGFKAIVDRIDEMRFVPGRNDFRHQPNFVVHALEELHIEFTPRHRAV